MFGDNIFTDELLESLGESLGSVTNASTLPPLFYTSDPFLEFEKRAVFDHEWLCLGLASRIPEPGDYFAVTILDEPLIVTRGKDGRIRVLSAVCQHRSQQLVDDDASGNCNTFKCPYHHWIFGNDGRLLGAPAMERTEGFDKSDWGLPQLQVELWNGFIFAHFDDDAAPLAPRLAAFEPYLEHYELENAWNPGTFVLEDLPWNWKVMFENFNDGYHATRLHEFVQSFCPSELAEFPIPWSENSGVIMRTNGYLEPDCGFNATHKAMMPIYPGLTDVERQRSCFALIPPMLCMGTAPDQAFFFLVRPKSVGTIDVEIGYLLHPSARDNPIIDHLLELSDAGVQVFVKQDQDTTMKVQKGLRSRFAPRGRYSWQEETHVQFNSWLVQRYRKHWPGPRLSAVADEAAS